MKKKVLSECKKAGTTDVDDVLGVFLISYIPSGKKSRWNARNGSMGANV